MKKVYTWAAQPARRSVTIADLQAAKGKRKFTQVTTNSAAEAAAAKAAGIDMIIANSQNVDQVRAGDNSLFLTASIGLPDYPLPHDILREAFRVLALGADAVMTARNMDVVEMLAREEIPVMGHLGLVPRRSTWAGGLRAIGKTAEEALELFHRFKRLEDAGAVLVEAEVIPGDIMGEISARSKLITVSLGSGRDADVVYLFAADICGESENRPRHARAFGNLAKYYRLIEEERITAFTKFREAANAGDFPSNKETVSIDRAELEAFKEQLARET